MKYNKLQTNKYRLTGAMMIYFCRQKHYILTLIILTFLQ